MSRHYQQIDWYDLPKYYDLVFSSLNRREIAFLDDLYHRYDLPSSRKVLEPACGSGRLLEGMAQKGYQVQGFDLSESMVTHSKARLLAKGHRARVWQADMSDFKTKSKVDFAFCLVSSFKYLLTEKAALAHLQCVASSLKKGGIYVLGFHLSEYEDRRPDCEKWEGARGRVKVECRIDSWPPDAKTRLEKIRSRMLVMKPSQTEAMESAWEFRTYDREQFLRLIRKVPALKHVATHNFDYCADEEIELGENDLDNVVILQKG